MKKKLLLLVCFLYMITYSNAQTILSPGDIAIIGTNYDVLPYEMTIVNLVPISAGTVIRITDYGYDEGTSTFGTASVSNAAEGSITWTLTSLMPAGTVTKFSITGGTTPAVSGLPGTVSVTGWTLTNTASCPVPSGGDNWFIFQGSSPTSVSQFVFAWVNTFAVSFNSINIPAGQFVVSGSGNLSGNTLSYLPPSLTLGSTAIALNRDPSQGGYHGDNNVYTGIKSGTKAAILAAICLYTNDRNTDNWLSDEISTYAINPGGAYFSGTNPIFTITAASIAITKPVAGNNIIENTEATNLTLSGTSTVETGRTVTITISDGVNPNVVTTTTTTAGGAWTKTGINVSTLKDGSLTITAAASDIAGNNVTIQENGVTLSKATLSTIGFEASKTSIVVYPNPVSSILTVVNSENNIAESIEVIESNGKVVASSKNSKTIDVSNLVSGAYFVKIKSGNHTEIKKIVKK